MHKSILHGFWRGVIAVGLGALLAPVVIHLLVDPISAGDGFFGQSWHWFWDQFFAFLPVLAIPVAIHALVTRYLGPGYPRARRAFRFTVTTLGYVRLAVVAALLALTFYTALLIPLSFTHPVLTWWAGGSSSQARWQGSLYRGGIRVVGFSPAEGPPRQISGSFRWVFLDYSSAVVSPLPSKQLIRMTVLKIPLWVPLAAFTSYPMIVIIAFLRGPLRRRRRQERGLCVACGYNLAGLIESRCPECGQPFAARKRELATGN